jgi:hypothetical protein
MYYHLKLAATQWCHCPALVFGRKHLRMTSAATYTRKRRIGTVAGAPGSSEVAPVDVKSEFAEFRHVGVVKKPEWRGRKVEKEEVEEVGVALGVPKDADAGIHPTEDVGGRGLNAKVGVGGAAGEVGI